jgi:hypothetical protein
MADPPPLVPARPLRDWMDRFPDRHAYRCLPLSIANTHGWEILSPARFEVRWTGGPDAADVTYTAGDDYPHLDDLVHSNFTHGIVTFVVGYLFVTEPGWSLLATGPFNEPRDGIEPLTGIVETDWLPYPFTMNWQFTRPGSARFERGDPLCLIFPLRQDMLDDTELEIFDLGDAPELKDQYDVWRTRRQEFLGRLKAGDAQSLREAWQKFYFKGVLPGGGAGSPAHKQKVRPKAPVDRRKKR